MLMYKSNRLSLLLKKMEQLDGKSFVIKDVSLKKKKRERFCCMSKFMKNLYYACLNQLMNYHEPFLHNFERTDLCVRCRFIFLL